MIGADGGREALADARAALAQLEPFTVDEIEQALRRDRGATGT